jgi:ParB/RepB/Spo0J family partition protein
MQSYEMLQLDQIEVTNLNPRKSFEIEPMEELKASIREHGILEPLIVRATSTEDKYELVAGERRFRAAMDLQLQEVPCIIRVIDDVTMRELMLLENLQRQDLEPMETAEALGELLKDGKHTQEELAKRVGRSQPWIANQLRLLKCPEELRSVLITRQITPKHVLQILPFIEYPKLKEAIIAYVLRDPSVTTKALTDRIDFMMTAWHAGELGVLDIDRLQEHRELKSFFNKTECKDCQHPCKPKGDNGRFCPNEECWSPKLAQAEAKQKETQRRMMDKVASRGGPVDQETLEQTIDWSNRTELRWRNFDKAECPNCDRYIITTEKREYCLDKKCLERKERAETMAKNKEVREEWIRAHAEIDRFMQEEFKGLSSKVLKEVIHAAAIDWRPSSQKALRPYGPTERVNELSNTARQVSEKDAPEALARLYIYHAMDVQRQNDVEGAKAACKGVSA